MDSELLMRMVGVGGTIDWVVVFSLALVSLVYFLAPVLGYQADRRGMLLIALYVLVGYMVVVLMQLMIQYVMFMGSSSEGGKGRVHLMYLFSILRLVMFIGAHGLFVVG